MLITISQRELSSEEVKMLRQRLWAIGFFCVIAAIMFYVFFSVIKPDFSDGALYPLIGFALFFSGIIVYMVLGVSRDLLRGEKQLIKGVITDKQRYKSSNSGRRKGSSNSRPRYSLHFGDKKFYVEHKHYTEVSVGEMVELHYAPYSKVSLDVIRPSGQGEMGPVEEKKTIGQQIFELNEQRENLPRRELTMSHEDKRYLKKYRNKAMGSSLSFVLIGSFMFLAFLIGTLLWWVMLFPSIFLLLLVVFFSRRLIKTYKLYKHDVDAGVKLAVKTKILDKQRHTGSGGGYLIRTDLGLHHVSSSTYEILRAQEDAIIFIGKHTGWFIEIQTKSMEELSQ